MSYTNQSSKYLNKNAFNQCLKTGKWCRWYDVRRKMAHMLCVGGGGSVLSASSNANKKPS